MNEPRYTPQDRREYEESLKDYWDYYSTMQTAEDKGKVQGRAEGRMAEKEDTVHRLKELGLGIDQIATGVGLTPDEVRTIISRWHP